MPIEEADPEQTETRFFMRGGTRDRKEIALIKLHREEARLESELACVRAEIATLELVKKPD